MEFLIYFAQCSAIIVTFVVLLRWLFPYYVKLTAHLQAVVAGVAFSIIGLVIMQMPLDMSHGLHMDVRDIAVMLSGVFGGPVSALISGTLNFHAASPPVLSAR